MCVCVCVPVCLCEPVCLCHSLATAPFLHTHTHPARVAGADLCDLVEARGHGFKGGEIEAFLQQCIARAHRLYSVYGRYPGLLHTPLCAWLCVLVCLLACVFACVCHSAFLSSFLPFFLSSFLPFLLCFLLPFFLSFFLPFFLLQATTDAWGQGLIDTLEPSLAAHNVSVVQRMYIPQVR